MELRPARAEDLTAVRALVERAYERYVPRIGRRPAPMDDDYAARIRAGQVLVLADAGVVRGVLVTETEPGYLHVLTIAVDEAVRGAGLGRRLLLEAEKLAVARGLAEVRLFTNAAMTENLTFYPYLGYREIDRRTEHGFRRVYYAKAV